MTSNGFVKSGVVLLTDAPPLVSSHQKKKTPSSFSSPSSPSNSKECFINLALLRQIMMKLVLQFVEDLHYLDPLFRKIFQFLSR